MRRILSIAAIVVAAILVYGGIRAFAQQPTISPFPLAGQIPRLNQQAGSQSLTCGGGTYEIVPSADHRSILRAAVDNLRAGDQTFSGSGVFPEGAVLVDSRGYFSVYFPGREPGQEITVSSYLFGDGLGDLSFTASPSMCGTFGIGLPRPGGLPDSGSGPAGNGPPVLPLVLGAGGLMAGLAALAVRRRAQRRRV